MKSIARLSRAIPTASFRGSISSRYFHPNLRARGASFADPPTIGVNQTLPSRRESTPPALSLLAFPALLRSYLITAASSSSLVIAPSLRLLSLLAHSTSPWLQHNPILYLLLKKTFYKQFCGGETSSEVQKTTAGLKKVGFRGVILASAKEIVLEKGTAIEAEKPDEANDIESWKRDVLETVRLVGRDGFAALKFSGAGRSIVQQLIEASAPSATMTQATTEICEYAKSQGVRLLFDAEQHVVQNGIDQWTLHFQRKYNKDGLALVYGTYQAYLRSSPATLAKHLDIAQRDGYTLGVKLVRGAYMSSDPRHLFWATKEETDEAYDGIAESLMRKQWNKVLRPAEEASSQPHIFPAADLVLASHNPDSVQKAMSIRQEQCRAGESGIRLAYGQLMGMADEVGCGLIMSGRRSAHGTEKATTERPQAYKYVVWGTVQECLKYLVRRAEENRDALGRARQERIALGRELRRRLLGA
ncbi:MAG: hypothetical protein LQ348_002350 [Seirophora lacunosa]|nr:MAG: hypothetical protein LQ348_002350 [Seirophora lacunosa]